MIKYYGPYITARIVWPWQSASKTLTFGLSLLTTWTEDRAWRFVCWLKRGCSCLPKKKKEFADLQACSFIWRTLYFLYFFSWPMTSDHKIWYKVFLVLIMKNVWVWLSLRFFFFKEESLYYYYNYHGFIFYLNNY